MPYIDMLIIIKKDFNELRKKDINEKFLLNIINKSKYIFRPHGKFSLIKDQSNSEADFISEDKFLIDAKLLLSNSTFNDLSKGKLFDMNSSNLYSNFLFTKANGKSDFYKESVTDKLFLEYIERFETTLRKEIEKYNLLVFFLFLYRNLKELSFHH